MSTLRQAVPRGHIGLQYAVSVEEVYPADPTAAPQARHLVTSVLRDWGLPALRPDAALVVTELITNAVVQGESAPPPEVLVRLSRTASYAVIQVGDHNPAGPPTPPRRVKVTEEHGRGLLITRTLSAHLAWFRQDDWKVVWAALAKPETPGENKAIRGQVGVAAIRPARSDPPSATRIQPCHVTPRGRRGPAPAYFRTPGAPKGLQ